MIHALLRAVARATDVPYHLAGSSHDRTGKQHRNDASTKLTVPPEVASDLRSLYTMRNGMSGDPAI